MPLPAWACGGGAAPPVPSRMSGGDVIGWKLDRAEREALLRRFPPRWAQPVADHVTLATRQPRRQPVAKGGNVSGGARQQQPIADPRAELQQTGGGEIVGVHHQARREAEEIDTAIRFLRQRCRYGEGLTPELQRFAVLQGAGQPFIDPDLAAGRAMADAGRRHADF